MIGPVVRGYTSYRCQSLNGTIYTRGSLLLSLEGVCGDKESMKMACP